ncbi:MAG: TolC family protein [Spirochaetales bacterium]
MSSRASFRAVLIMTLVAMLVTGGVASAQEPPLDLEALLELARSTNPGYAAAERSVDGAEYQQDAAESRRWPTVSVEGSFSYLFDPPEAVEFELNPADLINPALLPPGPVETETVTLLPEGDPIQYSLSVTLEQPILTWGRVPTGVRLAEVGVEAARLSKQRAGDRLAAEIETLYYSLYYAEQIKREVDEQARFAEQMVTNMRGSLESGAITESQFRGFVVRLAETELGLVELETQITGTLARLRALTGGTELVLGDFSFAEILLDSPTQPVARDAGTLIPIARENSVELALLESRSSAAELELRLANAERILRPNLALQARVRMTGSAFEFGGQGFGEGLEVSPVVTLGIEATVFDGGRARAAVLEEEVDLEQARLERLEAELELEQVVRERLATLRLAAARTAQAESEVREAALLVSERERELSRGAGSENALLEQQLAYHALRAAWLQQRLSYRRNLIELELIVGVAL